MCRVDIPWLRRETVRLALALFQNGPWAVTGFLAGQWARRVKHTDGETGLLQLWRFPDRRTNAFSLQPQARRQHMCPAAPVQCAERGQCESAHRRPISMPNLAGLLIL